MEDTLYKFFKYKAKDTNGFPCSGTLKAKSEEEAQEILLKRKIQPVSVELDREATSRLSRRTLNSTVTGSRKLPPFNELLSYAMPLGAAIIAIALVPIALHYVKPPEPELSPLKVIEKYIEYEDKNDYMGQYELLSPGLRKALGTKSDYDKLKKKELLASETRFGKASGVEELKSGVRESIVEARMLRRTGMDKVTFSLLRSGGKWTVDTVQDPAFLKEALEKIAEEQDPARRRSFMVELKARTGHSDLEIEELVKEHRKAKARAERGGDYIFDI